MLYKTRGMTPESRLAAVAAWAAADSDGLPLDRLDLLGRQVRVVLNWDDDKAVSQGQLLGFSEMGCVVVLEDDGDIHYCWPGLRITRRG